jgi:hypothetical protein
MLIALNTSHKVNRSIRLLLVALFLSAFPSGKTALSLCLDEEQAHLVQSEHLHLVDCHSTADEHLPAKVAARFPLLEKDDGSCVDVMLSTYYSTTLRQRTDQTIPAPVLCTLALVTFQQRPDHELPVLSQSTLFAQSSSVSLTVDAQRTVVLLI